MSHHLLIYYFWAEILLPLNGKIIAYTTINIVLTGVVVQLLGCVDAHEEVFGENCMTMECFPRVTIQSTVVNIYFVQKLPPFYVSHQPIILHLLILQSPQVIQ